MTDTKPLTDAELAEARWLCEAATPGRWHVRRPRKHYYILNDDHRYVLESNQYGVRTQYDARFIAASRDLVPRLLDEVGRLREENAKLALQVRTAARAVERFAMCPDHRDKGMGDRCIVCKFEESARREVRGQLTGTAGGEQ